MTIPKAFALVFFVCILSFSETFRLSNETSLQRALKKMGLHQDGNPQNPGLDPSRNIPFLKLKNAPVAGAALLGMALAALLPSLGSLLNPQPYPMYYRRLSKRSEVVMKPSRFDYVENQFKLNRKSDSVKDNEEILEKCLADLRIVNDSCQETFVCQSNSNIVAWNSVCNQALELSIETSEVTGMMIPEYITGRILKAWEAGRNGFECALVYTKCQKSVTQLLNAIGGLWVPQI